MHPHRDRSRQRPRPWGAWLPCLLLSCLPAAAQEPGGGGLDSAALAEAGRAALERLESQAASWTATTRMGGDVRVVVSVVQTPTSRRSEVSIEGGGGRRIGAFRVVDKDGVWYATEGRKSGKYRPYEAPFDQPNAYVFLSLSEPRFIISDERALLGKYGGTDAGVATFRTPLGDAAQRQFRGMLAQTEGMRKDPKLAEHPGLAETLERMRDMLQNGLPLKVEVASGMFVQFTAGEMQTELRDFTWLDEVDPREFDVEGTRWEDFTDDPTDGDRGELLMIGHNGLWSPGGKSAATDARLVDLRTGRLRRVPFEGPIAQPGCFLQGRDRVVVLGSDPVVGEVGRPYEVDLATGENRPLGGEDLASGPTLMPALSPDGKTLAVLHKGPEIRLLESQIRLIDLETDEVRPLGEPGDMAFLSWLPGGDGLVLLFREAGDPSDLSGPRTETIARIDLSGRITRIREGDNPVLLDDGKTILFEDVPSRSWRTCDLDGRDVRPFAGGLAGHGFPTPAPDGRRILMMRFPPGKAPEPVIFPIGEARGKPAITGPGLWATPAWR